MNGEGFETFVKQGDRVKTGQPLVSFDPDLIKEKASSTITPIVITNGEIVESFEKMDISNTEGGKTEIIKIKVKG